MWQVPFLKDWFVHASYDETRNMPVPKVTGTLDGEPFNMLVDGWVRGTRMVISVTGEEYELGDSKCRVKSAEDGFFSALPVYEPAGFIDDEPIGFVGPTPRIAA